MVLLLAVEGVGDTLQLGQLLRQALAFGLIGPGFGAAAPVRGGKIPTCPYAGDVDLVTEARALAAALLAEQLPRRWSHVQAVGTKAAQVSAVLEGSDQSVLVAAAWLHDIGYAPPLADTGFHPLDGGRWLRSQGFDDRVARLVAHHTCALLEADERGLAEDLTTEFEREESATADALWYCDATTGPDGQDLDVLDRLNEIRARYGPNTIVTRFIDRAEPQIVAAVQRTRKRLADVGPDHPM
ncbi:phosphohydrolase [Phytohabitans sp. ZYX-F-186]|uniref:Phosphohydrolase n=1 Tax=Phytohabitans maris TaxID=3071409 RepID=A0ABU0ZMY9_9ACTN|nr:HD domain-containing protein [Phytohabitans sp. ZYX-F-186]MDQ7908365.1 phosphohydrolase [Phytohabitans sp. ZYX-F-186]